MSDIGSNDDRTTFVEAACKCVYLYKQYFVTLYVHHTASEYKSALQSICKLHTTHNIHCHF